jgi:predicted TPR repeat methyltransferase
MSTPSAIQSLILEAQNDHRAGRLEEAEKKYLSVLRDYPNDPDALHFLGMLYFRKGERKRGIDLLHRSLESFEANPHAWNNLGNMLLATNQQEAAADAFEKATKYGDQLAHVWYNRAICLRRLRRYDEAIQCFLKTIELEPASTQVFERFGIMLYSLRRFRDAADIYRRWLQVEPNNPIPRHMLAAMTGEEVPARADDEYVRRLLYEFAESFDKRLQELGYRAPELLASTLGEYVLRDTNLDILDAGCGTGLCGPLLRSMAGRLTGVDISPGMIDKARARNIYDELVVDELCRFMRGRPAAFDVVISADTLVYFGALEEAAAAARAALRPQGVFAFTVEKLGDTEGNGTEGFRIQPHGRYAHREQYLREVLAGAGFQKVDIRGVVLRREGDEDVQGHLVVAM